MSKFKYFLLLVFQFITYVLSAQTEVVAYRFDGAENEWTLTTSTNGTWEKGVDILNEGSDGTKFWYTTASNYSNDAVLEVTSPFINLLSYSDPEPNFNLVLAMDIRIDTEAEYDGMQVQYYDGAWKVLGAVGSGFNWYNDPDVNAIGDFENGWSGDNGTWQTAYIGLPASIGGRNDVQFRVLFMSDGSTNDVGVAFDNFIITDGGSEILVSANGYEIESGDDSPSEIDNTSFLAVNSADGSKTKVFTITNVLGGTLNLTGGSPISISGVNQGDFSVTQPAVSTLLSGESTTFTITFDPSAIGLRNATVTITNDDSDESTYTFDIQGKGVSAVFYYDFSDVNNTNFPWAVTSGWTRGTSTYSKGVGDPFWHLTNMNDYSPNTTAIITSPTLNLSGLSDLVLYVDIRYDTEEGWDGFQIEYSDNSGSSWIDLGQVGVGINWFNNSDVGAIPGGGEGWSGHNQYWQTAEINLEPILTDVNDNEFSKFRVVFASDGFVGDIGVAFDNFMISSAEADIVVSSFNKQIVEGSTKIVSSNGTDFRNVDVALGSKTLTYTIMNRGGGTLSFVGGSPVTIGGVNSGDFSVTTQPSTPLGYLEQTTFTITFNPSAVGARLATINIATNDADQGTFSFAVGGTGDNAVIYHNFDSGDQGWTVTTNTNGNWVRGSAILNTGASGSYWHTSPSVYNNNAVLVIESPTLDLSSATDPFLSIDLRYDTDAFNDGVKIEFSDDDGANWYDLGYKGTGLNWYNDTDVDAFANNEDGWSGDNGFWATSELTLPAILASNPIAKLRLMFNSDASTTDIGAAFDNVAIYTAVAEIPLPVELISFTGVKIDEGILLEWKTGSELNNDYFKLERSSDRVHFDVVATVGGHGTSNDIHKYQLIDASPMVKSTLYYRLVQFDFDGKFVIHNAISVSSHDVYAVEKVAVYPNPISFGGELMVSLGSNRLGEYFRYEVVDVSGQKIYNSELLEIETSSLKILDTISFPSGIYLVRFSFYNSQKTIKLVVN